MVKRRWIEFGNYHVQGPCSNFGSKHVNRKPIYIYIALDLQLAMMLRKNEPKIFSQMEQALMVKISSLGSRSLSPKTTNPRRWGVDIDPPVMTKTLYRATNRVEPFCWSRSNMTMENSHGFNRKYIFKQLYRNVSPFTSTNSFPNLTGKKIMAGQPPPPLRTPPQK